MLTVCCMQPAIRLTVDPKTREEAAYETLRRAIVEGRWGQGEPLVGSRLADEMGVSRITVANALKRLSGEGFVLLTPHKEAMVARLDPEQVREIYLMRAELETLAIREATRRMTPRDLAELHAMNDEIGRRHEAGAGIAELRALDWAFHHRLRTVSGMPLLSQTLKNLADQCEGYRARLLDERPLIVPSSQRHAAILAALTVGDAAAAGDAMREHVLGGMRAVIANIDEP